MPTLPPIPQDTWDDHVTAQTDAAVQDGFSAIDQARQAQDAARQAEQVATAREQEESYQSAQSQLQSVLAPAKDAQSRLQVAEQTRSQLDSILAPARAAQQQAQAPQSAPGAGGTRGDPALRPELAQRRGEGLDDSIDPASTDWRAYAAQAAQKAGIDPALFQRQIQQESGFDPNARSGAGAVGIAQIVPSAHPGVNPLDPKAALDYAATWMRQLTDRYGGDVRKALAAYNAGPGNVDKYGGVPPFEETQRYVRTIYDDAGQKEGVAPLGAGYSPPGAPPRINTDESARADQWAGQMSPAQGAFGDPRATSIPRRVEAVGQFEQGLPYDEAAAICGPVAALAFAQSQGRNPDLAEARALAKQVGWTSTGGMNGVANEQALLTRLGVKSRLDTNPDFGVIAHDASSGNPVIISTPVHYYYASGYDPSTGKVFVGKTGTSRRGGGSWMTPQEIATLDGGINGALFVDNPQSPTPSVGADPMASGEGDRPASEFETPPPPEIPRRLGPESIGPTDLSRIGVDVPVPGPSEIRSGARRVADTVGAGIDWAGQGLVDNVQKFSADQEELARLSLDRARAAHRGETLPPDQEQRLADLSSQYGLALTGEPLASTGGRAASAAGEGVLGAAKRFFHGTGSAFDRPDAAKFDPNGLYGPGYYLTDNPAVAASYAETRATSSGGFTPKADLRIKQLESDIDFWRKSLRTDPSLSERERASLGQYIAEAEAEIGRQSRQGPNVRAIDVPEGLNLLDADAPLDPSAVDRINAALRARDPYGLAGQLTASERLPVSGEQAWNWLMRRIGGGPTGSAEGRAEANRILAAAGYDGLTHRGGLRTPIVDDAGRPIAHDVTVVFPESLDKLRNAISGTAGGIAARSPLAGLGRPGAANLAGAAAGGVAGYESSPDTDTTQQRLERIGAGALLGATGVAAARGEFRGPVGRALGAADESGLLGPSGRPIRPPAGDTAQILDRLGNVLKEATVRLPKEPIAHPEFLQPEAALPAKTVSLLRQGYDRVRNVLGSMGEAGQDLAGRLHGWREGAERDAAAYLDRMPTVKRLGTSEFVNMVDVLEGNAKPASARVAQAATEAKSTLDDLFSRATNAGVDVAERIDNYFPHVYKDATIRARLDTARRGELIRRVMDERNLPEDEATAVVHRWIQGGERDRRQGSLEMARLANLPGYEKTKEALFTHVLTASRRVNEVAQFGRDDAIANRLIDRMGAEGYPIALARDLFQTAVGAHTYPEQIQRLSRIARAYHTVTRLGWAVLGNATQPVNTASVAGVVRTMAASAKAAFSPAERRFADLTGSTLDSVIKEVREGGGWSDRVTGKAMLGFGEVETWNRRLTAIAGRDFARDMAARAAGAASGLNRVGTQGGARRALERLGLDADAIVKRGGKLTPDEEITAARSMVERTQFRTDPQDIPEWASHPLGRMVFQFKAFPYSQTAFIGKEILAPLKHGNVAPLVRFAILAPLAQAAATETRNLVQGRDPEEDPGMRAVQYALGPLGLVGDVSRTVFGINSKYVPAERRASMLVGSMLGPTAGTLTEAAVAGLNAADIVVHPDEEKVGQRLTPGLRMALRQFPYVGGLAANKITPYKSQQEAPPPAAPSRNRDTSRTTRDTSRSRGR